MDATQVFDDSDATEEDEPTDDVGRPMMQVAPSEAAAADPATAMAALGAADEELAFKTAANTAALAQKQATEERHSELEKSCHFGVAASEMTEAEEAARQAETVASAAAEPGPEPPAKKKRTSKPTPATWKQMIASAEFSRVSVTVGDKTFGLRENQCDELRSWADGKNQWDKDWLVIRSGVPFCFVSNSSDQMKLSLDTEAPPAGDASASASASASTADANAAKADAAAKRAAASEAKARAEKLENEKMTASKAKVDATGAALAAREAQEAAQQAVATALAAAKAASAKAVEAAEGAAAAAADETTVAAEKKRSADVALVAAQGAADAARDVSDAASKAEAKAREVQQNAIAAAADLASRKA